MSKTSELKFIRPKDFCNTLVYSIDSLCCIVKNYKFDYKFFQINLITIIIKVLSQISNNMGNSNSIVEKKHYGFRIYKLIEEGPLFRAGLKELEDFIIPPPEFSHDEYELREYLNKSLEKEIELKIYNLKMRDFTSVKVTPSLNWKHSDKGCLGALICFENFISAQFNLLRVVKVISNSLSEKIGFVPYDDYIVGVRPKNDRIFTLNSSEGTDPIVLFTNVLKTNLKKDIELYVYNSKKGAKIIKVNVTLKNNEVFGCDIIYGDGHEFPSNDVRSDINEKNSEIDLSNSMALSNNLNNKFKEDSSGSDNNFNNELNNANRLVFSKHLSFKNEKSYASSINLSRSLANSNENVNTRTISPISINKSSNNENEIDKGTISPLSLSKLSNENEIESMVIINYKDCEKNI